MQNGAGGCGWEGEEGPLGGVHAPLISQLVTHPDQCKSAGRNSRRTHTHTPRSHERAGPSRENEEKVLMMSVEVDLVT